MNDMPLAALAMPSEHGLPRLDPVRPRTMTEHAAEAIVAGAARGLFLPGDRLVEAEIARELGISRVPVREALRLLESHGIVVNHPYRGMRMMQVTNRSASDLAKVRLTLELMALAEVMERVAGGQPVAPLSAAGERYARLALDATADIATVIAADRDFHATLVGMAGNDPLLQTWESLSRRLTLLWAIGQTHSTRDEIIAQHAQMVEAIRAGDHARARATLEAHIRWNIGFDFEAAFEAKRNARGARR
jgi:DNA-binding GntR family transcriptional regulator